MPSLIKEVTLEAARLELGPQLPVYLPGAHDTVPALLDTGAAMSVIDVDLAQALHYPETANTVPIGGLGQGEEHPTFDIDVHIPDLGRYVPKPIASGPLVRSRLAFVFIVGRDVLLDYIFTIDGPNRTIRFYQR